MWTVLGDKWRLTCSG